MSTAAAEPAPTALPTLPTERKVPTRRISFDYPTDELPRHYVGGDLVMSHIVTVLSSLFPEGEDFFVRSVRNYRDRLDDPELKTQVAGFIGQEAIHGREHRNFNERLGDFGYPTRFVDRTIGWLLKLGQRALPKSVQLGITAALEHYTATLAYVLLTDDDARAMLDVPEVRTMFLWHALEESEHKAVAFDVYRTVVGRERLRAAVMNAVTFLFLLHVIVYTAISLLFDKSTLNLPRLGRSVANLRRSPWLRRDVVRLLRTYQKPDFHPDDHDTTALVAEWREKLFAPGAPFHARVK